MRRFLRTELLIGKEGMAVLAQKKVAVFGVGGVGSFAAEALVRSGVGAITLVDHDRICVTNLNRQIHALESTIGLPKVEVMAERLREINPSLRLTFHQEFFSNENSRRLVDESMDYVIDAIDTVTSKVELILRCRELRIPIISAMGAGNKLDPLRFELADISKTHMDPLAKAVRYLLREHGITKGVPVLFSTEAPRKPKVVIEENEAENIETGDCGAFKKQRQVPGSISFVPSVAGLVIAGAVIRDLLGVEIGK